MDTDSAPGTVRDFPVTESQYSEFQKMPESYEHPFSSFHFLLPTSVKKNKDWFYLSVFCGLLSPYFCQRYYNDSVFEQDLAMWFSAFRTQINLFSNCVTDKYLSEMQF